MSDSEAKYNLLTGTRDWSGSWQNAGYWYKSGTHDGFSVMRRNDAWKGLYKPVALTAGTTYTFSAMVRVPAGKSAHIYLSSGGTVNDTYLANSEFARDISGTTVTGDGDWLEIRLTFAPTASKAVEARIEADDSYTIEVCALMLVEGTQPAAWAPAEGEELAGGGAQMSANLLDGATVTRGTKDSDGYWVLSQNDGTDKKDSPMWRIDGQPTLTENQTIHMACSVMPDEDLSTNAINIGVRYKDAAGNSNWTGAYSGKNSKAGVWTRLEMECVVPSGMRVDWCVLANAYSHAAGAKVTGVTISYGSPVCLASSAHTPYATQDHVAAEYATKAALKVTSDAVTAEVEERGRLAGRVGTLESTSGTHTSKLEQLAASIKSLVKGESTYTDPDGASATSGIYSLVTQTRDSVTALFGSYTKTEDLASTQAVKDARKAGTDAASAASAAQSMANTAKSAASAAQSTADTAKANAATAQSTADRAQSTADAALDNAGTANGRVRAVEARVSASIDGLDVRVRGVSEAVSAQGATVRDVERNMSFGLDGLVIGAADSASKVRITEKRETFEVDGKTVLALDGDTSTVEASALKIGGYVWTATNGGKNLTLVYRG